MPIFSDSCVSSVLEDPKQLRWGQLSSCIHLYTAVLRAVLSCSHKKYSIFKGIIENLNEEGLVDV